MRIVAASGNAGKLKEIKNILPEHEIISMAEAGFTGDIEETGTTFAENALIKAQTVCKALNCVVLADDSGLCVDALNGAPGVYSARYAGKHGDDAANNRLVLKNLENVPFEQRTGWFECSIALCFPNGTVLTANGKTFGKILTEEHGNGGFGYDPLFWSDDLQKPFGEASASEKDAVSHRGRALQQIAEQLRSYKQ